MKKIKYVIDGKKNVFISDMYRQLVTVTGHRTTTVLAGLDFDLKVLKPYRKNTLTNEYNIVETEEELALEEVLYYNLENVLYLSEVTIREEEQEDKISNIRLYKLRLAESVMYLEEVTGEVISEVREIVQDDCEEYIRKRVETEIEL